MHYTKTIGEVNLKRRRMLVAGATVVGGIGLGAVAIPFIKYMEPSDRARNAGAPVTADVSKLEPGQQITVGWRGQPIWFLRRTDEMLKTMQLDKHRIKLLDPDSEVATQQPAFAQNAARSIHEEHLVVIGICTHLGCVPTYRPEFAPEDLGPEWDGGYFCPCHGSRFDLAGRVYKGVPAPTNLVVPPYRYLTDTLIEVGVAP